MRPNRPKSTISRQRIAHHISLILMLKHKFSLICVHFSNLDD
ncbi:hypothetical protein QWZ13_06310 [Reinekea marina]|nr:hypothetical protein [Reinekea marina]MDN3648521.1 hypothetical protein [Reinekea marina]